MSSFTPARILYDLTINILKTNLRLAESFATLMAGASPITERAKMDAEVQRKDTDGSVAAAGAATIQTPAARKYVYRFGAGSAEGAAEMRNLLGGKGANLAEMSNLGLPVPPGFTITTEVCTAYYANGRQMPAPLVDDHGLASVGQGVDHRIGAVERGHQPEGLGAVEQDRAPSGGQILKSHDPGHCLDGHVRS